MRGTWYNSWGMRPNKLNTMQIILKHMNAEDAWRYIVQMYNMYQSRLKKFKYSPNGFIPMSHPKMYEMFQQSKLSNKQIQYYHDIFVNEIHDPKYLTKQDGNIQKAIPIFEQTIESRIKPLLGAWNATMPETLTILCTYGFGASYGTGKDAKIFLRISNTRREVDIGVASLMLHEFVHILIEEPIIAKYNVPQDLKERIVDIIGLDLFNRPVQQMFENSFANAYITPNVIKADLPGAVAKMMADYAALQQKQNHER